MEIKKIGIVVGSIRRDAYTGMVADYLSQHTPEGYQFERIGIADLPLYNQDYDVNGEPDSYAPFRSQVKSLDGVIFITPEHNRSIPAALKNALDVGSRPYGKNVWNGKPAMVISSSISGLSGFGANHHLRQVLTFLNMPTLQQPEVYLANIQDCFKEDGTLVKEGYGEFLQKALIAYWDFAKKFGG
ncbi:NADPH-dependent FMN reductase [Sphingobacterium luzhongxinii]|uniref:NADPH-dependent FMN reductase n=1 Tax=Sphingobacterium luzhongxinii TaxID=2654181 RepID=UPI0013DB7E46|nr:NAD(P)H-dependent oxidoreductase [Sphingobacterium sp. xlx-73]